MLRLDATTEAALVRVTPPGLRTPVMVSFNDVYSQVGRGPESIANNTWPNQPTRNRGPPPAPLGASRRAGLIHTSSRAPPPTATSENSAAHRLGPSHSTVKHQLANARSKVGAETTAQLVWILGPRLPEPEAVTQPDE